MFRTITAKYAGICRRCNGPIKIGDRIRYAGPGRAYHLASECPQGTNHTDDPPYATLATYDDPALVEPTPAETVIELEF